MNGHAFDPGQIWGVLGLFSFLAIFLSVVRYAFAGRNQQMFERAITMPLQDAPSTSSLAAPASLESNQE